MSFASLLLENILIVISGRRWLKFLNPTCMEKLSLVVGDCFSPSASAVKSQHLLILLHLISTICVKEVRT